MKPFVWIFLSCLLLVACHGNEPVNEKEAENCARDFAEAFFNFNMKKAEQQCADSSAYWLRMYVSNISQSDVDSIHALTVKPEIKIQRVVRGNNDSVAIAYCRVENAFLLDTIGRPGHLVDKAVFAIQLQVQDGKWKVKMEGLPRSEK